MSDDIPTPLTDAFAIQPPKNGGDVYAEWCDFARSLERKLALARTALEKLERRCSDSLMAHSLVSQPDKELIEARIALTDTAP